jgi:hypothetical protein
MSHLSPRPSAPLPRRATSLDQLVELEAAGKFALTHFGYRALADMVAVTYSALLQLQAAGVRGAEEIDSNEIENLGALFHRLDAAARKGMA